MDRRKFLKCIPVVASAPLVVNGISKQRKAPKSEVEAALQRCDINTSNIHALVDVTETYNLNF